jgi:hypothetical protein
VERLNSTGRSATSKAALIIWTVILGVALAGCGGGIGSYCSEAANCEGGNDADEEACAVAFDASEEVASNANCDGEFDEWFECVEDTSRCNNDFYEYDRDGCQSAEERFFECIQ